jgi:hypothetical protein
MNIDIAQKNEIAICYGDGYITMNQLNKYQQ